MFLVTSTLSITTRLRSWMEFECVEGGNGAIRASHFLVENSLDRSSSLATRVDTYQSQDEQRDEHSRAPGNRNRQGAVNLLGFSSHSPRLISRTALVIALRPEEAKQLKSHVCRILYMAKCGSHLARAYTPRSDQSTRLSMPICRYFSRGCTQPASNVPNTNTCIRIAPCTAKQAKMCCKNPRRAGRIRASPCASRVRHSCTDVKPGVYNIIRTAELDNYYIARCDNLHPLSH